MAMSEPARFALITVGVAMGEISILPLIRAFDAIPEPFIVMTSASRPYFSKSLASLVTKIMMLPMLTDGTPTRIFLSAFPSGEKQKRTKKKHTHKTKTKKKNKKKKKKKNKKKKKKKKTFVVVFSFFFFCSFSPFFAALSLAGEG